MRAQPRDFDTPKDKTWKHCERQIMARLGGERIPVTGRHHRGVPDGDGKRVRYAVEIKHRKVLPKWLLDAAGAAPCRIYLSGAQVSCGFYVSRLNALDVPVHGMLRLPAMRQAPKWLVNAFLQAQAASKERRKPPLVCLHARGMRYDDVLCITWERG